MLTCVCVCVCVYTHYISVYMHVCTADAEPSLSLCVSRSLFFAARAAKTSVREESAGGKNKARKTLGMVNVKQIIKYGEKTTEKQPIVLRQHMLIRSGLLH